MNRLPPSSGRFVATWLMASVVVACGTSPAPDFRGKWRPVNVHPESPQAIALRPALPYAAHPMDRSLKIVLERWSRDAGLVLVYQAENDYTLHAGAVNVQSSELYGALAQMERAYAAQRLVMAVEDGELRVRVAAGAETPSSGL